MGGRYPTRQLRFLRGPKSGSKNGPISGPLLRQKCDKYDYAQNRQKHQKSLCMPSPLFGHKRCSEVGQILGPKNGPFLDPSKKSNFTTKNFGGRPDFQKSTILSPFFTFLTFFQKTHFFGQNIKNPYSLKVQKSAKIDRFWVIFGPFFRT